MSDHIPVSKMEKVVTRWINRINPIDETQIRIYIKESVRQVNTTAAYPTSELETKTIGIQSSSSVDDAHLKRLIYVNSILLTNNDILDSLEPDKVVSPFKINYTDPKPKASSVAKITLLEERFYFAALCIVINAFLYNIERVTALKANGEFSVDPSTTARIEVIQRGVTHIHPALQGCYDIVVSIPIQLAIDEPTKIGINEYERHRHLHTIIKSFVTLSPTKLPMNISLAPTVSDAIKKGISGKKANELAPVAAASVAVPAPVTTAVTPAVVLQAPAGTRKADAAGLVSDLNPKGSKQKREASTKVPLPPLPPTPPLSTEGSVTVSAAVLLARQIAETAENVKQIENGGGVLSQEPNGRSIHELLEEEAKEKEKAEEETKKSLKGSAAELVSQIVASNNEEDEENRKLAENAGVVTNSVLPSVTTSATTAIAASAPLPPLPPIGTPPSPLIHSDPTVPELEVQPTDDPKWALLNLKELEKNLLNLRSLCEGGCVFSKKIEDKLFEKLKDHPEFEKHKAMLDILRVEFEYHFKAGTDAMYALVASVLALCKLKKATQPPPSL